MPELRGHAGEPRSGGPTRGQRLVLLVAEYGRDMTEQIAAALDSAHLATNTPALVLCHLAARGPLRPRDLLGPTHLTRAAMTKHLDLLEEAGLIRRTFGAVAGDRRAIVVHATPEGERAARIIGDTIEAHFDSVVALRDELTRLIGD